MGKRLFWSKKTLLGIFMCGMVMAIVASITMGYAMPTPRLLDSQDNLRPPSAADTDVAEKVAKDLGYGFRTGTGETWAHDKIFRAETAKAFNQGRAVSLIGHQPTEDLEEAAAEFLQKSGELGISQEQVVADLKRAQDFLREVFSSDEYILRIIDGIAAIDETQVQADIDAGKAQANALPFLQRIKAIAEISSTQQRLEAARLALIDETRFITLIFGMRGADPFLFSVGNILSKDYRAIVAHMGTYAYDGSQEVEGGSRTVYTTLARILGFADAGALDAYREMMLHEFEDRARGRHVDLEPSVLAQISQVNEQIDRAYLETERAVVTEVQEEGPVVVSNSRVTITKFRVPNDLGVKEVFAIKGSSRVHPDIPKGEGEVTVTIAKADIGSIGGHGTAPGVMLEAVAEIWMQAAERGEILDFFITRVGDDISVTVTHAKGKDDVRIHELIWNGFVAASVIAKDHGWYGAGQDLLADAFSGNVKGAGPSCAEMTIKEQGSEVMIFGQADKTAPGAFNMGLWEILYGVSTTWRPLGPGTAKKIQVGVLDFNHNDHAGRHIVFGQADYDDAYYYLASPDRYTIDEVTTTDGDEMAAVTAQRLGVIAGEYVGKDDPMFMIRSQKKFAAVGEIASPFLKGDYVVPGWMRGSNKGPFMPEPLVSSKIGIFDGPPLLSMWAFNITNGRLTGFYDLFAANSAIREIQNQRTRLALRMLNQGFNEMGTRLPQEEIEYQKAFHATEARLKSRWEEFEPDAAAVEQQQVDEAYDEVAQERALAIQKEMVDRLIQMTWGAELAPFAQALQADILHMLSDEVLAAHTAKDGEALPILINHESLLKAGQDGVMALQNILEQLGEKGNIQFVLHIVRDDIRSDEVNAIVDESLERINQINNGYTRINRNDFAAIVVGTDPAAVAQQVRAQLGAGIYQVIGPVDYVNQFTEVIRVGLDPATEGQMSLMAKALKLGLELIPTDGVISPEALSELDELLTVDGEGTFHVQSSDVTSEVETTANDYEQEVEAEVRI